MPPPRAKSRFPLVILLAVPLLLVAYVFSMGPASWLNMNGWIGNETVQSLFAPVWWAAEMNATAKRALLRYCLWWEGDYDVNPCDPR